MSFKDLVIGLIFGATMIAGATAILIYAGPSDEYVERKMKEKKNDKKR